MYEPSESDDESKHEQDSDLNSRRMDESSSYEQDVPINHEENSKSKTGDTPGEDTSMKMSSSEHQTEVDQDEVRKQYNIEEHKYPLEYRKYLKIRETDIEKLIRQKSNCFGNFGVSLFWEEKIILTIKYLQFISLTYIAFIEYWPYDFDQALGNVYAAMGFNFIYVESGYYKFIVEEDRYNYNIAAWLLTFALIFALGSLIILIPKLRHEFKHSKTLFKKWAFNVGEILYLPLIMNTIPMLACQYKTIKNGFQQHECKGASGYIYIVIAIGIIFLALVYNVTIGYMILKRKISYRHKDHKMYVKRKELEYVLEISDNWRKQSFFMFSSFKGTKLRMFFKPFWNLVLLFLVCAHAWGENNMENKSIIFSGTLTALFVIVLAIRPYRCASTNFLLIFQVMHIAGPVFFVTQSIRGMQHGLLVNYYFSICIYLMIGIFCGSQVLV